MTTKKTESKTEASITKATKAAETAWKAVQEKQIMFARENAEAYFKAAEASLAVASNEERINLHTDFVKDSISRQIEQVGVVSELALKAHKSALDAYSEELTAQAA